MLWRLRRIFFSEQDADNGFSEVNCGRSRYSSIMSWLVAPRWTVSQCTVNNDNGHCVKKTRHGCRLTKRSRRHYLRLWVFPRQSGTVTSCARLRSRIMSGTDSSQDTYSPPTWNPDASQLEDVAVCNTPASTLHKPIEPHTTFDQVSQKTLARSVSARDNVHVQRSRHSSSWPIGIIAKI